MTMATQTSVSLVKNVFVAILGDGRRIKHADLNKMAYPVGLPLTEAISQKTRKDETT
jgi:hypothetical protein